MFSSSGVRWVRPDTISTYVPDDGITVASHTYDNKGNPVRNPGSSTTPPSSPSRQVLHVPGRQPAFGRRKERQQSRRPQAADNPGLLRRLPGALPHPHFSEIHLLDLRYYKLSIADYIAQNGIDQALVLYSVPNFVTDSNLLWIAK
mgnify:CR=1 FL=1